MLDADTLRARLTDWLPSRVGAPSVTVTDLTPPSGTGYSSETLLFTATFDSDGDAQERRYVVRFKPTRPGVFPEYDIEMQYRILETLGAHTDVPVPATRGFEPDSSLLGTPFYQVMLAVAACRAVLREARGERGWEKTAHTGAHRKVAASGALELARSQVAE